MQMEIDGEKKRTSTTALVFDAGKLDLNLTSDGSDPEPDEISNSPVENLPRENLPF
jgi:hypothetical protein